MKKIYLTLVILLNVFCVVGNTNAISINGFFIDNVPFIINSGPGEYGTSSVIGIPDGAHVDFDGGAATFTFSQTMDSFDYGIDIPEEADLIIVGVGNLDIMSSLINFGYGIPIDANIDGFADNGIDQPLYLETDILSEPPWSVHSGNINISFFDLDCRDDFTGFSNDFFLSVNDYRDLEIDAIHLISSGSTVPEPATILLVGIGLLAIIGVRRKVQK